MSSSLHQLNSSALSALNIIGILFIQQVNLWFEVRDWDHSSASRHGSPVILNLDGNSIPIADLGTYGRGYKVKSQLTMSSLGPHEDTSDTVDDAAPATAAPRSFHAPAKLVAKMYPRSGLYAPITVSVMPKWPKVLRFQPIQTVQVIKPVELPPSEVRLAFKAKKECRLIRATLSQHGLREVSMHSSDFNVMWTTSHIKSHDLRALNPLQKVNHFPRSSELTRKDRLYVNIVRMQQSKGRRNFDIVPESFLLPSEYNQLYAEWLKDKGVCEASSPSLIASSIGPFIVKPVGSSQGRGISIASHPRQIVLDGELMIASRYIRNPLLVGGKKVDLRLYCSVTSYSPICVYLYKEGLARFATEDYNPSAKTFKDAYSHLTNYSINKKSDNFLHSVDGNVENYGHKWSLTAFLHKLEEDGMDVAALMARIEDLIIKTIIAGELPIGTASKLYAPNRNTCFELYGFDVIVDKDLKPWLLEVNLSPSLSTDSPLDLKIKSHLVADQVVSNDDLLLIHLVEHGDDKAL